MTKSIDKKTLLKNVNFDFDPSEKRPLGCHVHYTLGAASLMDEPLLLKSKEDLTEDEIEILEKIKKSQTQTKDDDMGDDVNKALEEENAVLKTKLEKFEELEKELKKTNVEKSISDFPFSEELTKEVIEVMVDFDEKVIATITKAFSEMKDFEEEKEENALQKQLKAEAGADGDGEVVEESLSDQIKKARKKDKK